MDWITPILAAFIGGGFASIATWWINWRKAKPEIARMYEEMATKQAEQIDQLRERVNKQDRRLQAQDRKIEKQGMVIIKLRQVLKDWEEGIRILVEQLTQNGLTPCWEPKSVDDGDYDLEEGEVS